MHAPVREYRRDPSLLARCGKFRQRRADVCAAPLRLHGRGAYISPAPDKKRLGPPVRPAPAPCRGVEPVARKFRVSRGPCSAAGRGSWHPECAYCADGLPVSTQRPVGLLPLPGTFCVPFPTLAAVLPLYPVRRIVVARLLFHCPVRLYLLDGACEMHHELYWVSAYQNWSRRSSSEYVVSSTTSCNSAATMPSASIRISASNSATSIGCRI